jgi:two-component system phosphate regulon response regulator PhoB
MTLADARPRVLIVEDDPALATVIQLMLAQAGFQGEVVTGGQLALDRLDEQSGQALAAAVLLDLALPDMDGLAVLQRLRASPRTRELPVIVLTARPDARARRDSLGAGATAHLTKPVRPALLAETLRLAVERLAVG